MCFIGRTDDSFGTTDPYILQLKEELKTAIKSLEKSTDSLYILGVVEAYKEVLKKLN